MAGRRRGMPAAPAPESIGAWLERHTARAPAPLRARGGDYAAAAAGGVAAASGARARARPGDAAPPPPAGWAADTLACAGAAALARVLAQPGDRSAALDLLAADAL